MCGARQEARLYQSDLPMTTLHGGEFIADQITRSALPWPHHFQAQAQNADSLCLNSIPFDRQ